MLPAEVNAALAEVGTSRHELVVAAPLAFTIGLSLGIAAWKYKWVDVVIKPILSVLQTDFLLEEHSACLLEKVMVLQTGIRMESSWVM